MDAIIRSSQPLRGTLVVPPDKAICHRAVLAAALAQGTTHVRPWPSADDCQRTLQFIQALGVPVAVSAQGASIEGRGAGGLRAPQGDLWCGESGTTFRLAAGVLAGQPFTARLSAGPSLSRRPMRRIVEPLSQMGARLEGSGGSSAAGAPRLPAGRRELYPPLTIQGRRPLAGIRYEMPIASAQVKSAILFAALFAKDPTTIIERAPTRDHTERMLRAFGAALQCDGQRLSIQPGGLISPGEVVLPGDVSSAAFFVVAASCVPGSKIALEGVGLNPRRTAYLDVVRRMGGCVTATTAGDRWEPRGTIAVEARRLRGTAVEPHEVPGVIDELPILMVAAACAHGATRFCGIGELRVKETDRIQSVVEGLRQLGARVTLPAPDTVEIAGGPLRGSVVGSAGDHRTAMSLAVAGLVASGSTTVKGAGCVAKSFPGFFEHLHRVAGSSTVKIIDTVQGAG